MVNMYIVKSAGIRSYPHLFQKHHFLQTTCKNSNTVMTRSFKEPKTWFFFSPREKITLLKFEIFKLTKRKQKQLHCLKSLAIKILVIHMPPAV